MWITTLLRRPAVVLGAAMWTLSLGCASTRSAADAEDSSPTPSAVLVAELGVVVDEAIRDADERGTIPGAAAATGGGDADAAANRVAFVEAVRRSLLAQHGEALLTTPAEERRFRDGKFAHTSNRSRVEKLLRQFRTDGVPLNTVEAYLADQFAADMLDGARLELAARLLKAHYDAVLMSELLTAF